MFSLKIVTVDHYQANPIPGVDLSYSDFRGSEINNVPVIRVFGMTPKGQKACLHVHGVFPYISLPFDGGGDGNLECLMQQLCLSIDSALNIASGKSNAHIHHIYKISVISGIPFYGYHEKKQKFFRIFFYNPETVKKAVELLQIGAVMNQVMQPYEAHIPYVLQFFIDYNLYGMSTIDVSKIKFRIPLNASDCAKIVCENHSLLVWETSSLPSDMIMDESIERLTCCEVECDCNAEDILNRKMNDTLVDVNPGLKFIWDEERQRRQSRCKMIKLTPLPSQKRDCRELTESEAFYKNRLQMIVERIPKATDIVEEINNPRAESPTDVDANGELVNCTLAGVVEIHKSFSQGKEVSEHSKSVQKTNSLTQDQFKDKPLTQSQNTSTYEDKEFLEMIISMIDNQNCSSTSDLDNIVINQQSGKSVEQKDYIDTEDELEMSLCIWDEDVSVGSEVIPVQNNTAILDRQAGYEASKSRELNMHNEVENTFKYSIYNSGAKDILTKTAKDCFTIPQIDGMHDITSPNNSTTENVDCSRRELSYNSTSTNVYTTEASWVQATYTSSSCDKYNFCYDAYTSFNQPTYCPLSRDQYNNYSSTTNQSVSTILSENYVNNNYNNSKMLHNPSNSCAVRSVQSNIDIFTPSFTLLSNVSTSSLTNSALNEKVDSYKHITKYTHLCLPSTTTVFSDQLASTDMEDHSLYKTSNIGNFTTINTKALKENSPKTVVPYKSHDYLAKLSTNFPNGNSFDVKKIELNNIGTQIYPCRVGELLSVKTKTKSVCNTSTQKSITDSQSSFHQEDKVEKQRKSNPRTLLVQHMKRLKLSLSKNYCHQKMENSNDSHNKMKCSNKYNTSPQENLSVVQKLATNLKSYLFIHRHAPESIQKKKVQNDDMIILSSLSNSALAPDITKDIVLPSYVKISDLDKIGYEKVIIKRLESDISKTIDKNKFNNQNAQNINNKIKKTNHLPILTVKFKMAEVETLNEVQKLERETKSIKSQSILHKIRKNASMNSGLSKRHKKRYLSQNNNTDIVTYGLIVKRCEKKVESENKNCSATSEISIECKNKATSVSQIDDDLVSRGYTEKSPPGISKCSSLSKLSRSYTNKVKRDHNEIQNSTVISGTINKETGCKNATNSSISKLSKKHKSSRLSINHNNSDIIVSSNVSINKTKKKLNSKSASVSVVSKLSEAHIDETGLLNKSNNMKSKSSLNINGRKKQSVHMNNFVISKIAKETNKKKFKRKVKSSNKNSNTRSDVELGSIEDETKNIGAECCISKLARKSVEKLNSLNQIADNTDVTPKSASDSQEKELVPLKRVPLKLTIKLPSLIKCRRVKKRKRKNTSGFQAFQPSSCWKSLTLSEGKSIITTRNNETRPKRPNVDYQAYAYTHLLEFDKMIELPCDKVKNLHHNVKSINDPGKYCRKLEIRLERLKPEFLESINLQQKDYICHKEMGLRHNFKKNNTKFGKEIYQCLNVYPVSVDTNTLQIQHTSPENSNNNDDNLDVMWNLSYLSPSSDEHDLSSPPQCWSPYDNISDESSRSSERENSSLQFVENSCSNEFLHSVAISLQENKRNSDVELFHSESDSLMFPSFVSNIVPAQDYESSLKSQMLSELTSDKNVPCKNAFHSSLSQCNVEKFDRISQHFKCIPYTSSCCRNVSNVAKIEVSQCDSDTVNKCCKNISEENIHQLKTDINSNHQNDSNISNDNSNHVCDNFLQKYKNENEHVVQSEIKVSKNDNITDKLSTISINNEIDSVSKRNYSSTEVVLPVFNVNEKISGIYQSEFCENKSIDSTIENTEVETNPLEKEIIKETSKFKNILVTNNISLSQEDIEFNSKIISEKESLLDKNKNLCDLHNEETIDDELCQKIEDNDINCIKLNNIKNALMINTESICTTDGYYNKCNLNSEKSKHLCNKSTLKNEYVLSSLQSTNRDDINADLFENSYNLCDRHCDEKEVKEFSFLSTEDTFQASNFTKNNNDKEPSQLDTLNKIKNSNSVFNDDADYKESEKNFYKNNEVKQIRLNKKDVYSYSNPIKKQYDNTENDKILDTEFVEKNSSSPGIKDGMTNVLVDDDLHASDQLNSIKASCNVNIYNAHTSQDKNSELNSFTENCDLQPLSPEEKVIYDSQGNIMSSSTKNSQYSVCLGNHYVPQDGKISFENCSKVLNRSRESEYTLIKSNNINNYIQETTKCIHDNISVDKNLPEHQIIQNTVPFKSMLNLHSALQIIHKNSKQLKIAEMPKENHLGTENECFKEENCRKFYRESCLVHNNPLETECNTKHSMLLGPFKEVPYVPLQTNSELSSNALLPEINHVSEVTFDKSKLMIHLHQITLNETEIVNISCNMCYDKDKDMLIPVKLYDSKYCKSVIQPITAKVKNMLQQYSTPDLVVNLIESKNNQADDKYSKLSNEINFTDIAHNDVVRKSGSCDPYQDSEINNDEAIMHYARTCKTFDACDDNIIKLNIKELKESTLMDNQCKKEKIYANESNSRGSLIFKTKNYAQDLRKPIKSDYDDSIHIAKLIEDNTSDVINIYLNETSSISQMHSNDTDLKEISNMQQTDKTNYKNSDICSFYTANTLSSVNNITICSDESIQLSYSGINSKIFEGKVYIPQRKPPTFKEVIDTFVDYGILQTKYQSAFFSVFSDAPKTTSEFGKLISKISTVKNTELLAFDGMFQHIGLEKWQNEVTNKYFKIGSPSQSSFSIMDAIKNNLDLKVALSRNNSVILLPVKCPPSRKEVEQLLSDKNTTFEQEVIIEKASHKLEYKNIPETEMTVNPKEKKHKFITSLHLKEKCASPTKETDCSFHQHSTPLTNWETQSRKRERSSSWSGGKTKEFSQLLKRRRTSGDHISFCFHDNSNSKVPFAGLSPICSLSVVKNNKTIQGKERRKSSKNGNVQCDKFDIAEHSTPSKKIPITKKNFLSNKIKHELLTIMSLEIHVQTRKNLRPDPKHDPIKAAFYCISNDFPEDSNIPKEVVGIIIANDQDLVMQQIPLDISQNSYKTPLSRDLLTKSGITSNNITFVKDEISLLKKLIDIVRKWNPDIICGYEIQMLSWGFLIQRAAYLNINLYTLLSRVPEEKCSRNNCLTTEEDYYSVGHIPEIHITGRIVLNVWRLMRKEVTLNIYTFENVAYHILHQRIPSYSFSSLTHWFNEQTDIHRWRVINFYIIRAKGTLHLLHHLDLISRTSTLARIFGIQFHEVLSRGSQFRVESMMLRSAKPLNYVPVSPSIQKRANSKAPECFPLIMEPESKFYTDPVIVLDFQSLYPSMMIAYNYCYSTCLGRIASLGRDTAFEFGCASLTVPPMLLKKLENDITISPNGVAYVKHHIRMGVLPQMLEEILSTRIMVKKAMKEYKDDKDLYKLLDGRQLALKLISNVTYGYTGANYSGRMPCVEVADSIVGKARETLERAIRLVERTAEWDAKVVYGDTDSMFILLKGRNKEQAFKIGQEIAEAVTAINPKPVKLKFEKVYLPCLLQTKKRYVGFMYETPEQLEPIFDAKGIETVRRDSCPAAAKILEKSLKMLFTSKDISVVKRYVQKQFQKFLLSQANIQDCIFAREYRGMSNYRANACVPALEIARRLIRLDPRAEPRAGERIPYVIIYGFPGLPLIQLIHQPQELLDDPSLKINAKYYISRVIIPPLHRVFSLIGINVASWYIDMPWKNGMPRNVINGRSRGTLSQYLTVLNCPICNEANDQGICSICKKNPQLVILNLSDSIRKWERNFHHLSQICKVCAGTKYEKSDCISLDCPILFKLYQANKNMSEATYYRQLQQSLDF